MEEAGDYLEAVCREGSAAEDFELSVVAQLRVHLDQWMLELILVAQVKPAYDIAVSDEAYIVEDQNEVPQSDGFVPHFLAPAPLCFINAQGETS